MSSTRLESVKWLSSPEGGKVIVHPIDKYFQLVAKEPASLVSIFGRAREGKSFLMNCLACRRDLFGVSNGHDPCTQGIDVSKVWMPLRDFSTADGGSLVYGKSNIHVGFLDAEGQGDKDVSYDANLICPILLLSKCVIFNWKGDLQKDLLLSSLGVMARAAQNVAMEGSAGKKSAFGHLHIVFRDWQAHNSPNSSCLAVQDSLFKLERSGPGHDARNRIRTLILESFSSVRVWLFDPPSEYTKDLKQKLVFERTSDVFRTQVRSLREALSQQLKEPTYLAGNVLTGRTYIPLTEQIADALNNGRAVLPSSAYLGVIRQDLDRAHGTYKEHLRDLSRYILDTHHIEREDRDRRWADTVDAYSSLMRDTQYFASLSATITEQHNARVAEIVSNVSGAAGSPVATILSEYATQTQEIHSSAEAQFLALYAQQFTLWLQTSQANRRAAFAQTVSDSADVAEAMLCQVNALEIAPMSEGDDTVGCFADAVCAEICVTMTGTLEAWLLHKQEQLQGCVDKTEDGIYQVSDTPLSQEPILEALLQEEAAFLNDLRAAIYGQAPAFKAQWRFELGEGRAQSPHTPHTPSRETVRPDWAECSPMSGLSETVDARCVTEETTATEPLSALTEESRLRDAPPHAEPVRRGSFLQRVKVSLEQQREKARNWAQNTLGLRFDSTASVATSATSSTMAAEPVSKKSFAQQKRDAMAYARRMFGGRIAEKEKDDDTDNDNQDGEDDMQVSDDSFMHIDADSTVVEGTEEGADTNAPSPPPLHRPVPSPVRAPVSSRPSVTPTIVKHNTRGARTPAQSGVLPRPSTPVLEGSDSEEEEEEEEPHPEMEELATDTISEITGAFVVPPAPPAPLAPTAPSARPLAPPAYSRPASSPRPGSVPAGSSVPGASRAQTPALEPALVQFYKRCLADIYAHTTRCELSRIEEYLAHDSPAKSLKAFESRLCHKIRTPNRNLATLLTENDCTFLCDVDFNTEKATRSSLDSDPAERRSPSPDRRDSTSRASLGSGVATRGDSTLTSDSTSVGVVDRGNSIFKAGAYQVRFKDPVVSKANCIFFHLFGRDRFIKAKIPPLGQRTIQGGLRRRANQLVEDGFTFGGRKYHFLGGEGQDKSFGQGYFFATHDDSGLLPPISVGEVRQALADFDQVGRPGDAIKPTKPIAASKINARLMLGFSPTYPALQVVDRQVIVIDDVPAGDGGVMTDGCGFISASLLNGLPFAIANGAKFCARRLPAPSTESYRDNDSVSHSERDGFDPEGDMCALAALPNTIQVRLSCRKGLFKGCLTVTTDPALCPDNCIVMRQSMLKVGGPVHIGPNTPCTLFVNRTFEKSNALSPACYTNAPAGIGSGGGNPWTANFSVDLALLLCHLGLPLDHVLRLALRELDEIGDISRNRSMAMEHVHRILRRFDRKDPDDADYSSDDEESGVDPTVEPVSGADDSQSTASSSRDVNSESSADVRTTFQSAAFSMCITSETAAMKALHFLIAGHSLQEPQLQRYLSRLQIVALDKLRRLKFRLPNSAYLVGVPDPYNQLKEGEVFAYLPLGDSELRTSAVIHSCDVLVTRYPLHHPGDIRKLRAVQNEALSALVGQSSNAVLFFSTQGARSQADKMGGGDFDGDEYCLIFNQSIVQAVRTAAPYHVSDFPPVTSAAGVVVKDSTLRDGMGVELLHSMLHHANNSKVGLYSSIWQAFADHNPASVGAKTYDHLARLALDAAKTGLADVSLTPPELTEKPHYLAAKLTNVKNIYHSETVVGVVTDVITDRVTALQPLGAPPVADPDIYCVLESGEVVFDVTVEITYRQQRQLDGHEVKWDLWERWKANFDRYRVGVGRLSDTTTVSTDHTVQMQTIKNAFIEAFDAEALNLHLDPRYRNFTGYTARRVLASIVYHLTYENCKSFANYYRVGFCWEVCPAELHDNKKRSVMKRAHQHEYDLLPATYWKDMYNI